MRLKDKCGTAEFKGLNAALSNAPFETAYTIFNDPDDIVNYANDLILSISSEFIHAQIVTIIVK